MSSPRPLIVDVDGTLIASDILHESTLQLAAQKPHLLPMIPLWLMRGKARLKREIASRIEMDLSAMPLRPETLAKIREAQAEGRPVYLASASEQSYVEQIAAQVDGIAGVFGTGDGKNLAGAIKAELLNATFGRGQYDYIGDRPVDFAVWDHAANALAVSHSGAFERRLRTRFPQAEVIATPRVSPSSVVRALRPHQWAKNLLVFASLVLGHYLTAPSIKAAIIAFVCFCCAASSAYLLNDLLDLPADRLHPTKRKRPFASGAVPLLYGVVLSPLLMLAALALAISLLPVGFVALLLCYYGLTLAYSLTLKRRVLIDVITLAVLYTLRVLAGAVAISAAGSPWLYTFSLFVFTCLALVKRCSELIDNREQGKAAVAGRGYRDQDLRILLPLAAVAGYIAVLVIALYIDSAPVRLLYPHADRLWLICPLMLYWVSRMLVICNRGEMQDDPVIFALSDKTGLFIAAACGGIALWATAG